MGKDTAAWLRQLTQVQGVSIVQGGNGHYRILVDGRQVAVVAGTSTHRRGLLNAKAEVNRALRNREERAAA